MAAAGLLDGRRCTVRGKILMVWQKNFRNLDITTDLFEIDGNRVTCSGGTASLDMMLNLISHSHGTQLAAEISISLSMTGSANQPTGSVWNYVHALV